MARYGYIVELSVSPGGARRGDIVVVGTRAEIMRVLQLEFLSDDEDTVGLNAYLAIRYGEIITAWVVEDGAVKSGIDLHPFIRASFPDAERAVALSDKKALAAEIEELGDEEEDFASAGITFELDEKGLDGALPKLSGPAVKRRDKLEIPAQSPLWDAAKSYLVGRKGPLAYGYHDLEGGGDMEAPHLAESFPA